MCEWVKGTSVVKHFERVSGLEKRYRNVHLPFPPVHLFKLVAAQVTSSFKLPNIKNNHLLIQMLLYILDIRYCLDITASQSLDLILLLSLFENE